MSERPQNEPWNALVRETHANPAFEAGRIAVALKAIKEAAFTEGLTEEGLPEEIRLRAQAYRETFPGIPLTPTSLARHWFRVLAPTASEIAASPQQRAIDQLRQQQ